MRIIGGSMRGRQLRAPKGDATRPTTDRVRESLFSALSSLLGPDLGGGPVLDAFAGSGALGLEALSRGAGPVTAVEHHRAAVAALRANVETLGVTGTVRVVAGDAFSLANRGVLGGPFALILLDPPYTLDPKKVAGLLERLASAGSIAEGCVVTWEHAAGAPIVWPQGFAPVNHKRYGTTGIEFAVYERGAGAE